MLTARVIPCLLLRRQALVKTVGFRDPSYIGDPVNAIRIYNEKEVDELIFLDITATVEGKPPPFKILSDIASECFMPVAYGGGVTSLEQMERIYSLGIEKVTLNTAAMEQPALVEQAARRFGSQAVVVSVDVRKPRWGRYLVYVRGGRTATGMEPVTFARRAQELGAGEILLTSMDRDGTMRGYDLSLVRLVTSALTIPVIACGGAGVVPDLGKVVKEAGASAAAAGSMFVYHGRNRAVLINFPTRQELEAVLK